MDRNNTSFGRQLRALFESQQYSPTEPLKYAQWVTVKYVEELIAGRIRNGGRGLIINHLMGVGKTITAIAISDALQQKGYSVVVIGPRTLEQNFGTNISKYSSMTGREILPAGYSYFTLRSSTLNDKILREFIAGPTKRGAQAHGAVAPRIEVPDDANLAATFRNKVVLIDEAHLFCNSVAHGRRVALELYRALMTAKDCYVFLLTGTLITNSPFEAVPAFNLVAGRMIFPEDQGSFMAFAGSVELIEKYRGRLQNLMSGYISYAIADNAEDAYPPKLATKIMYLPMEGTQLASYYEAWQVEHNEAQSGSGGGKMAAKKAPDLYARSFFSEDTVSSYKTGTRMASNGINKQQAIAKIVAEHPTELCLVQCSFVENGGIKDVCRWLESSLGYREMIIERDGTISVGHPDLVGTKPRMATVMHMQEGLTWRDEGDPRMKLPVGSLSPGGIIGADGRPGVMNKKTQNADQDANNQAGQLPPRWFALLVGGVTEEQLDAIQAVASDARNRYGAYMHVLCCSSIGSVGLDLKNGRHVIAESLGWHIEEFNQLMYRYVRFNSSILLPPDQRSVQPYILVSTAPDELDPDTGVSKRVISTDEDLLYRCLRKMKTNTMFMQVAHSVSIECLAGVSASPEGCRRCLPTGRILTTGKFHLDMDLPDPCHLQEAKGSSGSFAMTLPDATYEVYYQQNPLRVFVQTDATHATEIDELSELWEPIIAEIHSRNSAEKK